MAKSQRTRRTRRRKLPSRMALGGEVYHANFRSGGQHIRRKLSRDFDTAQKMLTPELAMNTYAKATDRGMRDAVSALPFAKAKTPDDVVPMRKKRG